MGEISQEPLWKRVLLLSNPNDARRLRVFTAKCECGRPFRVEPDECGQQRSCPSCGSTVAFVGPCFYCEAPTPEVLYIYKCKANWRTPFAEKRSERLVSELWAKDFKPIDVFICHSCIRRLSSRVNAMATLLFFGGFLLTAFVASTLSASLRSVAGAWRLSALSLLVISLVGLVYFAYGTARMIVLYFAGNRRLDRVQQPIVDAYIGRIHSASLPSHSKVGDANFDNYITSRTRSRGRGSSPLKCGVAYVD